MRCRGIPDRGCFRSVFVVSPIKSGKVTYCIVGMPDRDFAPRGEVIQRWKDQVQGTLVHARLCTVLR